MRLKCGQIVDRPESKLPSFRRHSSLSACLPVPPRPPRPHRQHHTVNSGFPIDPQSPQQYLNRSLSALHSRPSHRYPIPSTFQLSEQQPHHHHTIIMAARTVALPRLTVVTQSRLVHAKLHTNAHLALSLGAVRPALPAASRAAAARFPYPSLRPLRTLYLAATPSRLGVIMPGSSGPEPPNPEPHDAPVAPAELSEGQYHAAADDFIERLLARLEERADEKGDLEVEYSVRSLPSIDNVARN